MFTEADESKLCKKQTSKIKKKSQNICQVNYFINIINLINLSTLLNNWIILFTLTYLHCTITSTVSVYVYNDHSVTEFSLILQEYHDAVRDHLIKTFIKSKKKQTTLGFPNCHFIIRAHFRTFSTL